MSRSLKNSFVLGAVAVAALVAMPANAAVTLFATNGANAVSTDENVLLTSGQTGTTVFGTTNNTQAQVTFNTLNGETVTTPANGQARIQPSDGSLATLEFFLTNPALAFKTFEFNLFSSVSGVQSVTLFTNGALTGQTFTNSLGNGGQFFSGAATLGDSFTKISFQTSGAGSTDLRQLRLGGVGPISSPVPEPAAWMLMILGFAGVGFAMRKKNYNQTARVRFV